MPRQFLTARWESLALLNYACPRALLEPLVPAGTALDAWEGETLVSLVAFRFAKTRLLGLPVPFHRTFEEANLRFYVTREEGGELRRAVVFVRELVPRIAIATVARLLYNEPYSAVPMAHTDTLDPAAGGAVEYTWRYRGERFALRARAEGAAQPLVAGSEGEFITEHYWGYTRQRDGGTLEYRVEHPRWEVWEAAEATFEGDATALYGADFAALLREPPRSAFIAVGSEVAVYPGKRLDG